MIVDSRTLANDTVVECDICVIGAGAAGLTMVQQFLHRPFRVCLLESGGLRPDSATQALFSGQNVGTPYFDLAEARQACFGGTTAVWSGWCRPLDPIDFEARAWVPYSGWPFDRAHLDPYYRRAESICQLGSRGYEVDRWIREGCRPPPLQAELIRTGIFQFSPRTHFGRRYFDDVRRAANVHALLHANAMELETSTSADSVSAVHVATPEGGRFRVSARLFVLAAGGIENPRLLLLSNRGYGGGLGNGHDLVGRFFMDHPYVNSGWQAVSGGEDLRFYRVDQRNQRKSGGPCEAIGVFVVPDEVLRREELVNVAIFYRAPYHVDAVSGADAIQSLRALLDAIRGRSASPNLRRHLVTVCSNLDQVVEAGYKRALRLLVPPDRLPLRSFAEPVPNRESRVSLAEERDSLGRRKVRLDWKLGPVELRSMVRAHALLDQALQQAKLGRVDAAIAEETGWPTALSGGRHHMGTTRMHVDPRLGVVDADCKVHGLANLFVAGSSVFPTAGYANPTLTIVALSLRLADHLIRLLPGA